MPMDREKQHSKRTVSEMGTLNTEEGEEKSKGKDSPFSISTIMDKEKETVVEELINVEAEISKEETTLAENMKGAPTSEGIKDLKGKDYPFYVITVTDKDNENTVEEESKVKSEIGTEEKMLAENLNDVLTSEGVKKTPTPKDLMIYGKNLI